MHTLKQSTRLTAAALAAALVLSGGCPVFGAAVQKNGSTAEQAGAEAESTSFDEAIDALYERSGEITDEEILKAARAIPSDVSRLYSELEAGTAGEAADALAAFEEAKSEYIRTGINGDAEGADASGTEIFAGADREESGAAVREWDLQGGYARMLIGEGSSVRELIPRYKVVSCEQTGDVLEIGVEEWMTQGYGPADGSGDVSASSYSYTFSLSLRKDGEKSEWIPFAINGTESNFTWLREEVDPESLTGEAPAPLYAVESDLGAGTIAYAEIGTENAKQTDATTGQEGEDRGGELLSFIINEKAFAAPSDGTGADGADEAQVVDTAAAAYTYSPAKAAAYADKYWKKYNRNYREYRGVDCANFVSQCLYAGGMPKTSDWYPQSVNWINVMGHIRHFKAYGTFVTASNANVRAGNPVYYDWNGNGVYDHTAICVGTNSSGMPVVDAHTNNVYHAVWRMGSGGKRGTILLRTGKVAASSSAVTVEKNKWKTVSGKVYYLGSDGKPVRNRFLTIGGKRYYFNASGVRMTGSFKVGSYWYYAEPSSGALATGWKKFSGKYYYYSPTTYYKLCGGKKKIGNSWYFFNNSGVRQYSFIITGGKWYYADKKTGKFVTGWKKIHGEWYFFDRKTMVKAIGWKTIDGRRCYFNSKGILKKGKHG